MDLESLRERKKLLKMTTYDLAALADLPVSTVSKIMTGETKNPSFVTIEKLDRTLWQEELKFRLRDYIRALDEYMNNTLPEEVNQKDFESEYRKKHNLSDGPIPFATPLDSKTGYEGSLALKRDKRVSFPDIKDLDEKGHIELLKGTIFYNNFPSMYHQIIVQKVGRYIEDYILRNRGKCKMFNVGINVFLCEDDYTVLGPDIIVNCDDARIKDNGIVGAPDFVCEVVSPGSRHRDYNEKMHAYMEYGVREYWIIDPEKERVTTYIEGEPMLAYVYSFEDEIPVYIYDGELKICIQDVVGEK